MLFVLEESYTLIVSCYMIYSSVKVLFIFCIFSGKMFTYILYNHRLNLDLFPLQLPGKMSTHFLLYSPVKCPHISFIPFLKFSLYFETILVDVACMFFIFLLKCSILFVFKIISIHNSMQFFFIFPNLQFGYRGRPKAIFVIILSKHNNSFMQIVRWAEAFLRLCFISP